MQFGLTGRELYRLYLEDQEEMDREEEKKKREKDSSDKKKKPSEDLDEKEKGETYPIEDEDDLEEISYYDKIDLVKDLIDSCEEKDLEDFLKDLRGIVKQRLEEFSEKKEKEEEMDKQNQEAKPAPGQLAQQGIGGAPPQPAA